MLPRYGVPSSMHEVLNSSAYGILSADLVRLAAFSREVADINKITRHRYA